MSKEKKDFMIIGVTGTIGSGKSTVCNIIREQGYEVLDADKIHHQLMEIGNIVYNEIVNHFGEEVLNEDKTINRSYLRNIILNDNKKKEELESISFSNILARMKSLSEGKKLIFWEVPLLFEAGWDKYVDSSIVVVADEDAIIKRVISRSNLSVEEIRKFINAQMLVDEKIKKANYVLENNTNMIELTKRVVDLLKQIIH